MMNVYAKINEEANIEIDENGNSLPVYLNCDGLPESSDEEILKIISDLTAVPMEFISLVTEKEYNDNVDEEIPYEERSGCCGGCSGCSGDCSNEN